MNQLVVSVSRNICAMGFPGKGGFLFELYADSTDGCCFRYWNKR